MKALATNTWDLPFFVLYMIDHQTNELKISSCSGIDDTSKLAPSSISMQNIHHSQFIQTLLQVATTGKIQQVDLTPHNISPCGAWNKSPQSGLILPITSAHDSVIGILVVGLSVFRHLDDNYRSFLSLAAVQVSILITNARAHEEKANKAGKLY
jgi:hypothetical protein